MRFFCQRLRLLPTDIGHQLCTGRRIIAPLGGGRHCDAIVQTDSALDLELSGSEHKIVQLHDASICYQY